MAYKDLLDKQQEISNTISTTVATATTTESTPVNAVASAGTLTVAVQPIAGDTFTIGTKLYTFVADGTAAADGEVDVGFDLADAKTVIVACINGTDANNTANAFVTAAAFSGNDSVLTAITPGTAGDLIATTETFDNVGNLFDAVTLGTTVAGVNGTVGLNNQVVADDSYLYVAIADNAISGANWRRVSLGAVY